MENDKEYEIVGFDLGHGESAVAITTSQTITEPQITEINGRRNIISAIAKRPNGEILIGHQAALSSTPVELNICFKTSELTTEEIKQPIRSFANRIIEILCNEKNITNIAEALFTVGCPSGWSENAKNNYLNLLRQTIMKNVVLVPESRAAFLYGKESGDVAYSKYLMKDYVLIIDLGSSTADFTLVKGNKEHKLELEDFGENKLGASLIDKLIFERTLKSHDQREILEKIFRENPHHKAACELVCREAKEKYFSEMGDIDGNIYHTVRIPYKPPIYFEVVLSNNEMNEILSTNIKELNNLNWPEAFRVSLQKVRSKLGEYQPKLILLTGGASRMKLTSNICNEVFPESIIKRSAEPEFAIAKGLAIAGRIDKKTESFRNEIKEIFHSGYVKSIVLGSLDPLISRISEASLNSIVTNAVIPTVELWRKGNINTLNSLEDRILVVTKEFVKTKKLKMEISKVVLDWFETLLPTIEDKIEPICDKYNIPKSSWEMSFIDVDINSDISGISIAQGLASLGPLEMIINLIVTIVVAMICGGANTALIATGPLGLVVGAIIGIVAAIIGTEAARSAVMGLELPIFTRKLISNEKIYNTVQKKKPEIMKEFIAGFKSDKKNFDKLIENLVDPVEQQLMWQVEKVELLIK